MPFDFRSSPDPTTIGDLWARLVRLVASVPDSKVLKDTILAPGTNVVPHFNLTTVKAAFCQVTGTGPAEIRVTAIDTKFLTIYASLACTVDILVVL
jgi:hypothetical protein